jgi:hypothetical protein
MTSPRGRQALAIGACDVAAHALAAQMSPALGQPSERETRMWGGLIKALDIKPE